jgi:disulfide bond formation protein DsbB
MLVCAGAVATIAAVFVFQYGLGYQPCQLCYYQRLPYYVGIPLALIAAGLPRTQARARAIALGLLVLVFLVSAGLAIHHAGVEWRWWAGPAGCSAAADQSGSINDFMKQLNSVRVVSCTDAAWRFLGLSMAGWNVVVSLILAAVALVGARRPAAVRGLPR